MFFGFYFWFLEFGFWEFKGFFDFIGSFKEIGLDVVFFISFFLFGCFLVFIEELFMFLILDSEYIFGGFLGERRIFWDSFFVGGLDVGI